MELPVLWGGMHPTLSPLESIQYADMVLKGEGELALLEFVQALKVEMKKLFMLPQISGFERAKN